MRFDLVDLRLFLHVVDAGSITHGARLANLALPSASERLRGLEEACGVQLLERGRRGVSLTRAGEAFAHHARQILRQIDALQGELGEYSKRLSGTIRLLVNTAAISEFMPHALADWLVRNPHVDIDLKERASTEIVKAFANGLADIGVVSDAVDTLGLQTIPFASDRLVLVAPQGHPLATARQVAFAEAVQHEFVGLTLGSALQEHIGEHALRAGHPLRIRVRVRTFEGVCQMVARQVGIGIVPDTVARHLRRGLPLSIVRLRDSWAERCLLLCFREMAELSPAARDLLTHLIAVAPLKTDSARVDGRAVRQDG